MRTRRLFLVLGLLVLASPVLVLLAFLAMGSVAGGGYYTMPTGSMQPTLRRGETFLALPFSVDGDLRRGAVVIFRPRGRDAEYVKRIIGLPGERVALTDGKVRIDGAQATWVRAAEYRELPAPGRKCLLKNCSVARWSVALPDGTRFEVLDRGRTGADEFAEVTVPPGHVFVLGDDRDRSLDSRAPRFSMVPVTAITGRVWRRFLGRDADGLAPDRFGARVK